MFQFTDIKPSGTGKPESVFISWLLWQPRDADLAVEALKARSVRPVIPARLGVGGWRGGRVGSIGGIPERFPTIWRKRIVRAGDPDAQSGRAGASCSTASRRASALIGLCSSRTPPAPGLASFSRP